MSSSVMAEFLATNRHIEGAEFANKLIRHVHEDIKHLGVANTLATVREGR